MQRALARVHEVGARPVEVVVEHVAAHELGAHSHLLRGCGRDLDEARRDVHPDGPLRAEVPSASYWATTVRRSLSVVTM
ncbi:hypothetical protein GCM10023113_08820 [Cellulomonas oligotrophica]|uniref:UspA domain-containing protein n=1 Tax=Cellulomonas oligotrophica TaxID=931536 RepID=A0ABQ4D5J3_9CELL|nr:hypothetical protein Col01nite_01560 [Cellulomonas oligotrophica]